MYEYIQKFFNYLVRFYFVGRVIYRKKFILKVGLRGSFTSSIFQEVCELLTLSPGPSTGYRPPARLSRLAKCAPTELA